MALFHMDSIAYKPTPNAIQKALKSLPLGLNDTYDEVIRRINAQNQDYQEIAMRALLWIINAVRPLSVKELQHALAISPGVSYLDEGDIIDEKTILLSCAGIVSIDHESRIIRLVHYTAQEYFEHTRTKLFPKAQNIIVRACLTYLSFDIFSSGHYSEDFLRYAAENWGEHERKKIEDDDDDLVLNFLMDDAKMSFSAQAMLPITKYHFPGLHLAAYFGLDKYVREILMDKEIKVDTRDNGGRTALSWAAGNGHEAVVKMLLDNETPAVLELADFYGETPFFFAVHGGREALVKLLLERNDVNTNSRSRGDETPLLCAIRNEHENIVELLLTRDDVDINSKDNLGRTPLVLAVRINNEALVKMLLAKNPDVNGFDYLGSNPWIISVRNKNEAIKKMLVEHGVDTGIFFSQSPSVYPSKITYLPRPN